MGTRWGIDSRWEFGWNEPNEPGPQTEDSRERGFSGEMGDEQGRSDGLDPDEVGDIADEGPGHRG